MVRCARDDDKAVGVARLLWDGGYIAFLSDVIVDPEYQRQGIGKNLVESIIGRIKADMKPGYKVKICLLAAKGKEPFYEKLGFAERPANTGNLNDGVTTSSFVALTPTFVTAKPPASAYDVVA